MKRLTFLLLCFLSIVVAQAQLKYPKREFRGAWIQCINGQFQGKPTEEVQRNLIHQLDVLQEAGINAIIFQVRPEADALYNSPYEPWSRYLTGEQGKAPNPYWDPLEFMIEQCHKRNMELHAWINPYRAKTKGTKQLSTQHPHYRNPEMFFTYGEQMFFDPGLPQSRKYICRIVEDIVKRYDVDAIHMDDYFYPYPVPGLSIPDDQSFATYGRGFSNRADWRRDNVNILIKEIHETVRATKPWVKFGVSPFGIYRNAKNDRNGSNTNGLQNYDELYADVLLWVNNGWVDYNIPQVYWEIGHPTADYETLVRWWAKHASARPLYIGQDVLRTVTTPDLSNPTLHQMPEKYRLQRAFNQIQGSCQWYSAAVVENKGRYKDLLAVQYHRFPSLQPAVPFIDDKAPKKVKKLKPVWTADGYILFWTAPKAKTEMDKAIAYVVYRFDETEPVNLNNATRIVAITRNTYYKLDYQTGERRYRYIVTALDRLQNESKPKEKLIKL